jgi:hypothetical protein
MVLGLKEVGVGESIMVLLESELCDYHSSEEFRLESYGTEIWSDWMQKEN